MTEPQPLDSIADGIAIYTERHGSDFSYCVDVVRAFIWSRSRISLEVLRSSPDHRWSSLRCFPPYQFKTDIVHRLLPFCVGETT